MEEKSFNLDAVYDSLLLATHQHIDQYPHLSDWERQQLHEIVIRSSFRLYESLYLDRDAFRTTNGIDTENGPGIQFLKVWIEELVNELRLESDSASSQVSEEDMLHEEWEVFVVSLLVNLRSTREARRLFLLHYREFIHPQNMANSLLVLFREPAQVNSRISSREEVRVRINILAIIDQWLKFYFEDFDDDELKILEEIIDCAQEVLPTAAKKLTQHLQRHIDSWQNWMNLEYRCSPNLVEWLGDDWPDNPLENISPLTLLDMKLSPAEFAEQLFILNFEAFKAIHEVELTNRRFMNSKERILAPNVHFLIDLSTRLSYFVVWSILEESQESERIRLVRFFADVARYSKSIRDLHSVMAIISGLEMHPIYRLKHLRHALGRKQRIWYTELLKMTSTDDNYKLYRKQCSKYLDSGRPMIPHLGTHLRDLYVLQNKASKVYTEENSNPFRKATKSNKALVRSTNLTGSLMEIQTRHCDFVPDAGFLKSLGAAMASVPLEKELLERSKAIEPKMTLDQHRRKKAMSVFEQSGFL